MPFTILIVDDELEMCLSLSEILQSQGFGAPYTNNPLTVPTLLRQHSIDLIIMDIRMPRLQGIRLLKAIKGKNPDIPIIMITGYPSIENAVQSMKYGALNFYVKPLKIKELIREIRQIEHSRGRMKAPDGGTPLITRHPQMQELLSQIARVAPTPAPVLILGESGTGKELVARALHEQSPRKRQPLVKVNCASIPDSLLESELFGHEKGAFTDAVNLHRGKFELAGEGSIFLDEIADMSLQTQPKLLRVLQEGEFQRLGSMKILRNRARVISATNRDLPTLLGRKTFREDLFYRLSVVTLELPPLRARRDDIPLLADYFLDHFNRQYRRRIAGLSEEVRGILLRHRWPGNVRELKNCLERGVIFCDGDRLELKHLPAQYHHLPPLADSQSLGDLYDLLSREKITEALARSRGIKRRAAELLKINRKTLYNRMKKLNMI